MTLRACWLYADTVSDPTSCRSCGATVTWAQNAKTGRRMIFDGSELVPHSTTQLKGRDVLIVDLDVTISHFATCPDADAWRRPKATR